MQSHLHVCLLVTIILIDYVSIIKSKAKLIYYLKINIYQVYSK